MEITSSKTISKVMANQKMTFTEEELLIELYASVKLWKSSIHNPFTQQSKK